MYASRHLTATESRYSATERELLAIVWAAKKFNTYIYGRHATFVTDHQPLVTMKSLKEPNGRIGRLLWKLQDLDYTIVYQPGRNNVIADLLSRPVRLELNTLGLKFESVVNWQVEQLGDDTISKVVALLTTEAEDSKWFELTDASKWLKQRSNLEMTEGVLCVRDQAKLLIVVPAKLVDTV
jgi:hypothetical protein